MAYKSVYFNDPAINYSKHTWTLDTTNNRCYSASTSASITFYFTGTAIKFVADTQSNGDTNCSIVIDGQSVGVANFYSPSRIPDGFVYENTSLGNGEHVITITRSTTASKYIFCNYFQILTTENFIGRRIISFPDVGFQEIDLGLDRSFTAFFDGGVSIWNKAANTSCFGGSYTYSDVSGAEIKFGFTGTSIRIMGFVYTAGGQDATIEIDGVTKKIYGSYFPTTLYYVCLFEIDGLDDTAHDIVITSNSATRLLVDSVHIQNTANLTLHSDFSKFNITEWYGSNTIDQLVVGLNQTHPVQMYYDNTKDFMFVWQCRSGGENTSSAGVYSANICGLAYVYMSGTTSAPVDRFYFKNGTTNSYFSANSTFRNTSVSVCCIYYKTGEIKVFFNGELRYQGVVTLPDSGYYNIKTFRNGSSPSTYIDGIAKSLYTEMPNIPSIGAYAFIM